MGRRIQYSEDNSNLKQNSNSFIGDKALTNDRQLMFPTKPQRAMHNQQLRLQTNSYQLKVKGNQSKFINKYSIKFTPEIPDTSKLRGQVLKGIKTELKKVFNFYISFSGNLYSQVLVQNDFKTNTEHDGQNYEVEVLFSKSIDQQDPELYTFYSIFFKNVMRKLDFERIGRNFFNPKKSKNLDQYNLQVWPGFYSAMQKLEGGSLIQLDLTSKVVRSDSVLSLLNDYNNKGYSHQKINDEIAHSVIVTSYGNAKRTYRVERVDFEKSPQSTFHLTKEDKDISFEEYFKIKYGVNVKDKNQPLIITKNEKTGTEIALLPEMCELTGLTDSHRANFNLMKDLSFILHKNANDRTNEVQALIKEMEAQPRIKQLIDEWQIEIDQKPYTVDGQRIIGGDILMGSSSNGDCNPNDFDRKIQNPMFKQIPLQKWAIIYQQFNEKEANQFKNEIEKCVETFKFECQPPRMIKVQGGRDYRDWESCLQQNMNSSVTAIVLISPGQKGKSPIYDQLKKLLIAKIPVPSQVVLATTISKGKNLRSICNKILIQINAKIGGEPWAINQLPYLTKPTMIIGYDVHHKRGQKSLLAFCASINQYANRYWTKVVEQDEMQEIATTLEQVLTDAINAFKEINKIAPAQLVIYRDGVGDSQKQVVIHNEIQQIEQAISKANAEIKFVFVMVNKRVKTKMIVEGNGGRLDNPQPGTVLDHSITPYGVYDFFLVSQNCRQGVATPSHYSVLHDTIGAKPEDIQVLTYKLCYMYFNFSGPIKVPAPIRYADKLAKMLGERGNIIPHDYFNKINGYYYI